MDGRRRYTLLLSPAFLGLLDHAFFRYPFACMEDLVNASSSDDHGARVSAADMNSFLKKIAKEHTHAKAADDLKKGNCAIT